MINTTGYVDAEGSTNGRQALGVGLFWIPRSVWPGKPTDTGILLADWKGYRFTNLSAPVWSEMYINAKWPGIAVGSVLLGLVIGVMGERFVAADRENGGGAVGLGVISFYLLLVFRGSLLQSMATLTVVVACTLFVTRRIRTDQV
jgi:hypothetical protein